MIRPVLLLLAFAMLLPKGEAKADPGSIALERHPAGTYYVGGAVAGAGDMTFLIDTGSSYLVLGDAVLKQLEDEGRLSPGRELDGRMADGSRRIIPTYRVSAMRLGEDCWIHDVEAVAFPGNSRAILGMNVLAQLAPFTLSTHPPRLGLDSARCEAAPPVAAATHGSMNLGK